jgi:hypothetical protein
MFWKNLFERTSASLFALLFLFFSISSGIAMASPVHASSMPVPDFQDHSLHAGYSSENTDQKLVQQRDQTTTTGHTNNACAALCQTNTTKPDVSLPVADKDDDDETFNEDTNNQSICLQATDDPEPIYEDRVLKVPLYLKNCLLRI